MAATAAALCEAPEGAEPLTLGHCVLREVPAPPEGGPAHSSSGREPLPRSLALSRAPLALVSRAPAPWTHGLTATQRVGPLTPPEAWLAP